MDVVKKGSMKENLHTMHLQSLSAMIGVAL